MNEKVTVSRMKRHLWSEEIEVFNSQRGKRKVTKSRVTYTALSDFKPKYNEKGQRLCLNCGKIIEDKRRRKYCSEDCSHQWFRKHYWVGMRDHILKIQKYTCQKCGATPPRNKEGFIFWPMDGSKNDAYAYVVDHIIPIALGGGEFDEDNLQVLCGICDKEKTKADQAKITKLNKECKLTCLSNSFEVPFKEFYDLEKQAKLFQFVPIKKRTELTIKDLEDFFPEKDPIGQMLINQVRVGRAKAFQDEKGEIDFEYPVECEDCSDDCDNCVLKSFTFKAK